MMGTRAKAVRVLLWAGLAALGLCLVPRLPWELPLRLGYPIETVDTMPVLFNEEYGLSEYYETMRRWWDAGRVGPALASVPGRPGALFVRLGPAIIGVYPLGIAGNLAIALALLGIACLRRRSGTGAAHTCQTCGYNLTGNVSGRCPECGTEAREKPAEAGSHMAPSAEPPG
jgi:hypothetical protein